MNFGRMFSN